MIKMWFASFYASFYGSWWGRRLAQAAGTFIRGILFRVGSLTRNAVDADPKKQGHGSSPGNAANADPNTNKGISNDRDSS